MAEPFDPNLNQAPGPLEPILGWSTPSDGYAPENTQRAQLPPDSPAVYPEFPQPQRGERYWIPLQMFRGWMDTVFSWDGMPLTFYSPRLPLQAVDYGWNPHYTPPTPNIARGEPVPTDVTLTG